MSVCVWVHLVTQSCPSLCNSMDCILPSSSIHGMIQARKLERVAMPSSRGSSQSRYTHHLLRKKKILCSSLSSFLEKAMAPHSNTLAWKIPWTEEPSRLRSMGSLRVGHDWVISLSLFTFLHWSRKWQLSPMFLPGESQGQGAWWADVCGVARSRTRLKWLSSSRAPFPNSNPFPSLKSN